MKYIATLSFTDEKAETRYTFKRGSVVPPTVPNKVIGEWLRLGYVVESPTAEGGDAEAVGQATVEAVKPKPKGKKASK
jgi:hypothetical protein